MEKKNINLPYLFSILKQWLYETWSIRRKIKCAPILYATSSYILSKKESHVKILTALQLLPCVTDIFLLKAKKKKLICMNLASPQVFNNYAERKFLLLLVNVNAWNQWENGMKGSNIFMTVEINEADWFLAALLSNFTLNPFTLIVLNNNLKVLSKYLPNLKSTMRMQPSTLYCSSGPRNLVGWG